MSVINNSTEITSYLKVARKGGFMPGYMNHHRENAAGRRILPPLFVSLLIVVLLISCILPVAGANATATATTTATTTVTTSPTATVTHTTTQTTAATTAATTTTTAGTTATTSVATTTSTNQVQPVAGFTADTTSGPAPLTVQFTDLSTGGPVSWTWDFGDGESDTSQNPSHIYNNAGFYTVTLTAVNRQGTGYLKSESNYITVEEVTATPTETTTTSSTALAASFSGSPLDGTGTLTVQFTDSSSGSPESWSWDFGDGTTSTVQNPSHVFSNPGLYTVSLRITKSGGTDKTTKDSYITIRALSTTSPTDTQVTVSSSEHQSGTSQGKSLVYSTTLPTPVIRYTQAQANATPVLTGQAWIDRENKKLADAEAVAAAGQHNDIVSQIIGFFKGLLHWS